MFLVRIFSVTINVPRNLGDLVRTRFYFVDNGGWILFAAFLILFVLYYLSARKFSREFQYKSALIYPAVFLLLSLENMELGSNILLFNIFEGRVMLDDLVAILNLELFFESPFIAWSLVWYGLVFYFTRKMNGQRYVDILCLLPLLQFQATISNTQLIVLMPVLALVIIMPRLKKVWNPLPFHYLTGATFLLALAYMSQFSIVFHSSLLTSLVLILLVWVTGYRFIKFCYKQGTNENEFVRHSWFYLFFCSIVFIFSLSKVPMGPAITNLWFLIGSMSYVIGAMKVLVFIILVTFGAGLLKRKFEYPVFNLLLALTILFYLIDAFVFFNLGQRLDYHGINWVLGLSSLSMFFDTAGKMLGWKSVATIFAMIIVFYGMFRFRASEKMLAVSKKVGFVPVFFFIIAPVTYTGLNLLTSPVNVFRDPIKNIVATVPLFENILRTYPEFKDLKQKLAEVGFDLDKSTREFLESQNKLPDSDPANLIMITLESTGIRYLSLFGAKDMTMPNLETIKDRIEIFPFYFSSFQESANAEFSLFSGIMPSDFHIFRKKPKFSGNTMIEVLKAAGYDCSLFFSIYTGNTGILSFFAPRGADRLYDATSMPDITPDDAWIWGANEHFVVDKLVEMLPDKKESKKPFFVYYRSAFPHAPFNPIDGSEPVFAKEVNFKNYKVQRFKDCILYIDRQIFKIVKALKNKGLASNTYIMVTADHATSLGENGYMGHGWNLQPELTNVPFFIIYPESRGFKVNENVGSHIDFMPTALNLIGVKSELPLVIQGRDLRLAQKQPREVFLSSFNHLALIENHVYYWYLKGIQNARPLKMSLKNSTSRFNKIVRPAEEVFEKVEKMKKIVDLQKNLILNFENYQDDLNKNFGFIKSSCKFDKNQNCN